MPIVRIALRLRQALVIRVRGSQTKDVCLRGFMGFA